MQLFTRTLFRGMSLAVFLVVCGTGVSRLDAQDLTGAALISMAHDLITQLQNLGASVGGDVMIATNNGATQVSAATDHLNSVLHDQLNVPISELNGTLQNEALVLDSLITQMNLLLQHQRECLFSQADVFVAGINTALATFKSGVPFIKAGGPTVTSFTFDGHHTPNIVPSEAGSLVVNGFHLWVKVSPIVSITKGPEKNSQVLAKLDPNRGADDNSYRISLSKDFVAQHAGACVYLQTVPRIRSGFLNLGTTTLDPLVLPICVPQGMKMQVRLTAQVVYDVPTPDNGDGTGRPLDPWQNFRFDNAECNHTHPVSMSKSWALPDKYSIMSVEVRKAEQRNDNNNIVWSFNGDTLTAAGTQDSPTCGTFKIPPFGPTIEKLFHTAIWSYDARPKLAGIAYPQKTEIGNSDAVDVIIPATQVCLSLNKLAATRGRKTSISYTITPIINGKSGVPYSSPIYTTDDASNNYTIPSAVAFGGEFSIGGTYNPTPVAGKCQACITLSDIGRCGF